MHAHTVRFEIHQNLVDVFLTLYIGAEPLVDFLSQKMHEQPSGKSCCLSYIIRSASTELALTSIVFRQVIDILTRKIPVLAEQNTLAFDNASCLHRSHCRHRRSLCYIAVLYHSPVEDDPKQLPTF